MTHEQRRELAFRRWCAQLFGHFIPTAVIDDIERGFNAGYDAHCEEVLIDWHEEDKKRHETYFPSSDKSKLAKYGLEAEIPAMFCEHANEVPPSCPCESNCYCKRYTCKNGTGGLIFSNRDLSKDYTPLSEGDIWKHRVEMCKISGKHGLSFTDDGYCSGCGNPPRELWNEFGD